MLYLILAGIGAASLALIVWMVQCIRRLYGNNDRDRLTSAVGNALQELDRLVARPSVEHKVETEHTVHRRDDDDGSPL